MGTVTCQLSVSLDGFVAGPNQSVESPLGEGGPAVDAEISAGHGEGVGAYIMGRNMFGGGTGSWDPAWTGWWGDEPPYHTPVFVLTHHPRQPLPMAGGTRFVFVPDGIESALRQAREAAGDRDVQVSGGASVARQYLKAALVEQLYLHVAPVVLGAGERLWDGLAGMRLEPFEVVESPAVTHVRYRVLT